MAAQMNVEGSRRGADRPGPRLRASSAFLAKPKFQWPLSVRNCLFMSQTVNRFYVDVSGADEHTYLAAAGYLSSPDAWARFSRAWRAILRDAGGVHVFHATDFYSARGEFKGWDTTSDRHKSFAMRFTGAATAHTACGIAFGLNRQASDEIVGPAVLSIGTPHAQMTGATFCIMNCLAQAARVVLKPNTQHRAAVILEEGPGIGGTIKMLHHLKEVGEGWTGAYVSFDTMPKTHFPLQAADLLAHEAWRRITEVAQPTGREIRKSMRALLRGDRLDVTYAGDEDLRKSLPALVQFLRRHPEYNRREG